MIFQRRQKALLWSKGLKQIDTDNEGDVNIVITKLILSSSHSGELNKFE